MLQSGQCAVARAGPRRSEIDALKKRESRSLAQKLVCFFRKKAYTLGKLGFCFEESVDQKNRMRDHEHSQANNTYYSVDIFVADDKSHFRQ